MDFRILGPLEVRDGDRAVDLGGGKQRAVLAVLLVHANEVVSTDRLIDSLWGSQPPPSAAKIVQAHVSRLRRALQPVGEERPSDVLRTHGHGYVLQVGPDQLDRDRFERLLEEGRAAIRTGEFAAAGATIRRALGLWRGPPLADFTYDAFAREEIARLEELRLAALEDRIEADLAGGRHAEVVHELATLVRDNPLRERLCGQLMLALYRSGRQAEALRVYRDARVALVDDLGLEPSRSLQALERAILQQDESLEPPATRDGVRARARRGGLVIVLGALVVLGASAVVLLRLAGNNDRAAIASVAPGSVGVIDPETNRIVAQVDVGSSVAVTVGEGAVWAYHENTLFRLDPGRYTIDETIDLPASIDGIAVGEGAVWALRSTDTGTTVLRIDPVFTGLRKAYPVRGGLGPNRALAVGEGAVWIAGSRPQPGPADRLVRLDTQSGTATATVGSGAYGGLTVADGSVWLAQGIGTVLRLDPPTLSVFASVTLGTNAAPHGLAAGGRDVWVANRLGVSCPPGASGPGLPSATQCQSGTAGTVARIDVATNAVSAVIQVRGVPRDIAVGEGGVWVAAGRSVVRIDPATNRVVATIAIGAIPHSIAVGPGAVWVSAA